MSYRGEPVGAKSLSLAAWPSGRSWGAELGRLRGPPSVLAFQFDRSGVGGQHVDAPDGWSCRLSTTG